MDKLELKCLSNKYVRIWLGSCTKAEIESPQQADQAKAIEGKEVYVIDLINADSVEGDKIGDGLVVTDITPEILSNINAWLRGAPKSERL